MPRLRDSQVPLITLPNWVKAARACGFSIEEVFEALGIEADLVHVESATISSQDFERIMCACVERADQAHFPLALGQTFAFEYLPDVEAFLTTSATLRESTRIFEWLRLLMNPHLKLNLVERGRIAALRLDWVEEDPSQVYQWFAEATFTAVLKFGRALLGRAGDFSRATFVGPAPQYADLVREAFSIPVLWGQRHNALEMDRSLLDRPLGGASDSLHWQAEQRVSRRLSMREAPGRLSTQLGHLLEREPELLGQGIEMVASRFRMHPRTLQRRLSEEDEGFAQVQDRARANLARDWLSAGKPDLESISERLGFSDRRSFTRAFVRWTGRTPSQFRRGGSA